MCVFVFQMMRTYKLMLTQEHPNVFKKKFKINKDGKLFQLWLKKASNCAFVKNHEPTHVELKLKYDEFKIAKLEIVNLYLLVLQVFVDEIQKMIFRTKNLFFIH